MIQLQVKLNDAYIAVNPAHVTHVTDAKDHGCIIHFSSGITVNVKNDYLSVVGYLTV